MPDGVQFEHLDYQNWRADWTLIEDIIIGQRRIKEKGLKYLPMPNPSDKSDGNKERYQAYLERAIFYNFTARTVEGMTGEIFIRDPQSVIPDELDNVVDDADGTGVPLMQLAQKITRDVISYGRCGLLCDYPTIPEPTATPESSSQDASLQQNDPNYTTPPTISKAQAEDMELRPTLTHYSPWQIINWRTRRIGALRVLSLVVLRETILTYTDDNQFQASQDFQYRVLRLLPDNTHIVDIHKKGVGGGYTKAETLVPTGPDGKPLNRIPFTFVGVKSNDELPDKPPILDIATLNIGHYHNSADYEESAYQMGQPTVWISGLTQDWLDNQLKGGIALGSRGGIPLPQGAQAGILESQSNTMSKEAMDTKEKQAVTLGAQLVEQKTVQRTATESQNDKNAQTCTLALIANNVSDAITWALKVAAYFVGVKAVDTIQYVLNTDFDLAKLTPAERQQSISEWIAGATTWTEMRGQLRKGGVAIEDDDKAKAEIEAEEKAEAEANQANALALVQAQGAAQSGADQDALQREEKGGSNTA
jgi:Domain of unknown function (DUF4055)